MCKKLSFLIIIICFIQEASSQKLVLNVSNLPVRNGKIYENPEWKCSGCCPPLDAPTILTTEDSCFSLTEGVVSAVFDLGGDVVVIIRNDSLFFTYFSFKPETFTLKKGDRLSKGTFIGLLKGKEKSKLNELLFMVTKLNNRGYSFNRIVEFIRENMTTSNCEEAISYE